MVRYHGSIGYGRTVEVRPGVREDVIVERKLFGDVLRPSRSFDTDDKVIPDSRLGNRISILVDDEITANIDAIRFIEYRGNLWHVTQIVEERPRLILSMGEVYNGPRATTDPANI